MKHNDLTRREFIQIAGATVGGGMLATSCMPAISTWRFFSDAEAAAIEAIAEQIIPGDEDAGARDANVINFIDKQLMAVFAKHQHTYRQAIIGVQQSSEIMFGNKFQDLAWNQQTEVLKALEAGEAKGEIWDTVSGREFFALVRDHTMQGFYSSPRHGGNHRFASFKMLGLDYPRIVGQNRYNVFPGK